MSGARRVLDIGTFTGMSALAMSEGLPDDDPESCVVTLENIDACADVAEACFAKAGPAGARIKLIRGKRFRVDPKTQIRRYVLTTAAAVC